MLRLLADENFNGDIVRGLLLRQPDLDIVRVQDVDLASVDDPGILTWAAENNRIVVAHDGATMPAFAHERLVAGKRMPGVFIISDRLAVGQAIEELLLMNACCTQEEFDGRVLYLPL
ncbi:MAG: DUF5615 family PIN-like protein [Candidatus Sumerlaeota bacterium]|nr:DUF5615 family PIN-like protein [Candidatus Sumerlaeota bacterium]